MTRVLVTGGSGYIGGAVLRDLAARGIETHALGRNVADIAEGKITWHKADLLSDDVTGLLREIAPTHLLHLAWEATPGKYRAAPENHSWVEATLKLAHGFIGAGGASITFAGSCAEYTPAPVDSGQDCDEFKTPLIEDCAYAICKAAAARQLGALAEQSGIRFSNGRIFYIYGPGEPAAKLVSTICRGLLQNQPVPLSAGTDVVDYIYKDDAAAALVALALSDVAGPVNIGSGAGTPVRDIAGKLGAISGRPELLGFGQVAMTRPPVRITAATKRLTEEVGYTPPTPLDAGLRACYDFWSRRQA